MIVHPVLCRDMKIHDVTADRVSPIARFFADYTSPNESDIFHESKNIKIILIFVDL